MPLIHENKSTIASILRKSDDYTYHATMATKINTPQIFLPLKNKN